MFSKAPFLFFLFFFLIPDLIIYYVLAVLGLPCCVGFSLVAAIRGLLQGQYAGFSLQWLSCCGAQVLGSKALVVVAPGL